MTNQDILIVKRLHKEMLRVAGNAEKIAMDAGMDSPNHKEALHFFMGMGLTLAIIFEELTGKLSINLKPQELMCWARDLPMPKRRERLERIH